MGCLRDLVRITIFWGLNLVEITPKSVLDRSYTDLGQYGESLVKTPKIYFFFKKIAKTKTRPLANQRESVHIVHFSKSAQIFFGPNLDVKEAPQKKLSRFGRVDFSAGAY